MVGGGVVIDKTMIQARQLLLAIPANANPAQLQALEELQAWALTVNVDLVLTVFP